MDQFAVGMSKENKAIHLNTNTLEYKLVPLELGEYSLVITNTNKKRSLSESKYNERRIECDTGIELLKKNNIEFDLVCDLNVEDFKSFENLFESDIIKNRIKHAIYENDRTVKAVDCLIKGDFIEFGNLMNQSHDSLRDLYEVSCKELDVLVDSFRSHGATGSRMTGAGFGGCTINLVKTNIVEEVIEKVKSDYLTEIGYDASFYLVKTSDGARILKGDEIL
jgi:galactokinase